MDLIEQITTVATSLGWQVTSDTSVPNVVEFEFSQYTPEGHDLDFCAEMKDNDPDTLLKEIEQYIIGKTKWDEVQNQTRLLESRSSPKRKATKISHTRRM